MIRKAMTLSKENLKVCFNLSCKWFIIEEKAFEKAFKEGKLYYLIIDDEIKGFAIAYRYTNSNKSFLMVDYAAIDRSLEVKNYLWNFILFFGILDFMFYKKIKSNKYRLLEIDYESRMLNYINLKKRGE